MLSSNGAARRNMLRNISSFLLEEKSPDFAPA